MTTTELVRQLRGIGEEKLRIRQTMAMPAYDSTQWKGRKVDSAREMLIKHNKKIDTLLGTD